MARRTVDPDDIRARLLQEVWSSATSIYWNRRAEEWDAAAPRSGDFLGSATSDEIGARRDRCRARALACRRQAVLCLERTHDDVLGLVA